MLVTGNIPGRFDERTGDMVAFTPLEWSERDRQYWPRTVRLAHATAQKKAAQRAKNSAGHSFWGNIELRNRVTTP